FVRPFLQRRSDLVLRSQLVATFFKLPGVYFGGKLFKGHFQAFAEHSCGGGPFSTMEAVARLDVELSCTGWRVFGRDGHGCWRFDPVNVDVSHIFQIAPQSPYVYTRKAEHLDEDRSRTFGAAKHQIGVA